MQRLAALVPRPCLHLIRFHGVLAPNAKLRCEIIPSPAEHATEHLTDHAHAQGAPARRSWARLLKRVFDINIDHCSNCGGTLKIIAALRGSARDCQNPRLSGPTHPALLSLQHAESIYSKRTDPQAKNGPAIAPTIRLGPHSRKPPEGDEINRPEAMHGQNHPPNSAFSTKHSCA